MSKHYDRIPYLVTFMEQSSFKDTYAGPMDLVALESHLLTPKSGPGKTVVIFMHPVGGGAYLPMVSALAKAGLSVIYCNSRYRGADSALLMEKVVADLGACVRDAKERLGFEKVVLAGWSGGGSLSLLYQAEAEDPQITHTPAGDPYDLTAQNLIPADGIMLLAAHVSRAITMTEWLDPSVKDENNPEDRELDIYHPDCPNQPPYSAEFVARFRQAQIDRNRRITGWAKSKLDDFRSKGLHTEEYGFIVHRTMCDVRWLDPEQDSNERVPGTCYLGDPETVNNGPACAGRIKVPALVIGNTADNACTPSHTQRLFDGFQSGQATLREVAGANHYYFGQNDKLAEAVAHCTAWLNEQGLG